MVSGSSVRTGTSLAFAPVLQFECLAGAMKSDVDRLTPNYSDILERRYRGPKLRLSFRVTQGRFWNVLAPHALVLECWLNGAARCFGRGLACLVSNALTLRSVRLLK